MTSYHVSVLYDTTVGIVCTNNQVLLTLMLLVAIVAIMMQKKMTETLAYGYSSETAQRELANEYQNDKV